MFPLRVRGRSIARFHARQTLEDLERFEAVTLDTSHLAVAGLDPVEAIGRIGDRLAAWRESGVTTMLVSTRDEKSLRTIAELAL